MRIALIYIILILSLSTSSAQEGLDKLMNIADSVYASGNYFDAITEYKRVQFFDTSGKYSFKTNLQIANCYKKGMKLSHAKKYFAEALQFANGKDEIFKVEIELVKSKILERNFNSAKEQIRRMEKKYFSVEKKNELKYWMGWNFMFAGEWKAAADIFNEIGEEQLAQICKETNEKEYDVQTAKLLSYFIPGAGQFYTGEYLSGLMSLAWNAVWGYVTINAFTAERIFDGIVVGNLLWFRFYRGNFQNAEKFAVEKNIEIYNNAYKYLNEKYKGKKP
ncbi:MAG: hypothetical protein D6830_05465 [Ignavibacteria bacterium]|nr:MAG: hypothetical protein D6830_05465 [Ignavibacteria bacterium]